MRRVGSDPLSLFETIKDLYEYFDRMTEERRKIQPKTSRRTLPTAGSTAITCRSRN
jgi:hypothetical protein